MPVPDGFVLSMEVYRQYCGAPLWQEIRDVIRDLDLNDLDGIRRVSESLQRRILDSPLPHDVKVKSAARVGRADRLQPKGRGDGFIRPELAAKGILNTGTHFPKVGPVITAAGLIFTGTNDRRVRAFDVENGKMLWEAQVPEAIEGIPAVHEVGGRQYVVFCAAAQTRSTPTATLSKFRGAYVAFALRSSK
jgi:hypothetical protein